MLAPGFPFGGNLGQMPTSIATSQPQMQLGQPQQTVTPQSQQQLNPAQLAQMLRGVAATTTMANPLQQQQQQQNQDLMQLLSLMQQEQQRSQGIPGQK